MLCFLPNHSNRKGGLGYFTFFLYLYSDAMPSLKGSWWPRTNTDCLAKTTYIQKVHTTKIDMEWKSINVIFISIQMREERIIFWWISWPFLYQNKKYSNRYGMKIMKKNTSFLAKTDFHPATSLCWVVSLSVGIFSSPFSWLATWPLHHNSVSLRT